MFDLVRQLYAQLPESKVRGYHPRRFSFNKPGGRCEVCEGTFTSTLRDRFCTDLCQERAGAMFIPPRRRRPVIRQGLPPEFLSGMGFSPATLTYVLKGVL